MLLALLAEHGADLPIVAAAAVAAPIDLAAASRRILMRRNRVYHRHLLHYMKLEALAAPALPPGDAARIHAAASIWEFDDRFVAPRNGWAGAAEYYTVNSARGFLADVRVPTLVVHALDDPWIPAEAYAAYEWSRNPHLVPLLAPGGGHVGFHARDSAEPWHDRCIGQFFAARAATGRAHRAST
jgi:predicted alpha/beta-fold hydrolase